MNEGLASFMEYKCLGAVLPDLPARQLQHIASSPLGMLRLAQLPAAGRVRLLQQCHGLISGCSRHAACSQVQSSRHAFVGSCGYSEALNAPWQSSRQLLLGGSFCHLAPGPQLRSAAAAHQGICCRAPQLCFTLHAKPVTASRGTMAPRCAGHTSRTAWCHSQESADCGAGKLLGVA